jgi:hypothetical protein
MLSIRGCEYYTAGGRVRRVLNCTLLRVTNFTEVAPCGPWPDVLPRCCQLRGHDTQLIRGLVNNAREPERHAIPITTIREEAHANTPLSSAGELCAIRYSH